MRAVVLSGGLTHDFRTTRACLEEMLSASGFGVEVFDGTAGVDAALSALPGTALLVVTALRQTMTGPALPDRDGRALANTGRAPARGHRGLLVGVSGSRTRPWWLTRGFRMPSRIGDCGRPGSVDAGSCHEPVREPAMLDAAAATAALDAAAGRGSGRRKRQAPGAGVAH
jgi:hypothetical protein